MIYRRVLVTTAALLATSGIAAPAQAHDLSKGNGLYAACTSSDVTDRLQCMSFVEGYDSGITAGWSEVGRLADVPMAQREDLALYCKPAGVTVGQLKDIAVKWLSNRPEARHIESLVLLYVMFREAFPCSKNG